jgi:hypothetical protein
MATIVSSSSGNFTGSIWKTISTVTNADVDGEATVYAVSTSNGDSSAMVLAASAIDAVAIKVFAYINPTGTFTIHLRNSTTSTNVASVTVNCSDIKGRGWHVFSFAPHTPNGTDSYVIRVTRSVVDSATNRINLLTTSLTTAANISRFIRLTAAGSPPASGDRIIIAGELTGVGTNNTYAITMDNTATTSFGSTSFIQSITVNAYSSLAYNYSASTAYYLKLKGIFRVHAGGTFTIGTVTNPIPSTSSAVLEFDCAASVDSGLAVDGTFTTYGNAISYDRAFLATTLGGLCSTSTTTVTRKDGPVFTGLSGNIIIEGITFTISSVTNPNTLVLTTTAGTRNNVSWIPASTSTITTDVSTGWKSGDTIFIAGTGKSATETEQCVLSGDASGTSITLASPLVYGHTADTDCGVSMAAEIVHMNRNVVIRGLSVSLTGYVKATALAQVSVNWTEFYYMSSATADKRCLDISTTTGSFTAFRCSFHDLSSILNANLAIYCNSTSSENISITYCVIGNCYGINVTCAQTATNVFIDNCWCIGGIYGFVIYCGAINLTNCRTAGHSTVGFYIETAAGYNQLTGTWSNLSAHSSTSGLSIGVNNGPSNGTISNVNSWRNSQYGITYKKINYITLDNFKVFSNVSTGMACYESTYCLIKDCQFNGGTPQLGTYAIGVALDNSTTTIYNCLFDNLSPHITVTVYIANICSIKFHNCLFNPDITIYQVSPYWKDEFSFAAFEKYNQISGDNKVISSVGTLSLDASIFKSLSPSLRMAPSTTLFTIKSNKMRAFVESGTTITPSVFIRKSVIGDGTAYNGSEITLWVEANPAAGILVNTALAVSTSSSIGSWQSLSGTTITINDACELVFYCSCNGTQGWVSIDDFSVNVALDGTGFKYWKDGLPCVSSSAVVPKVISHFSC